MSLTAILAGCAAASPSPSPTVPPGPEAGTQRCLDDQIHPAGSRSLTASQAELPFAVRLSLTDGWKGCGVFFREEPDGATIIGFWTVVSVMADPCHWAVASPAPVGGSVGDLIQAVVDQQLTTTDPITDSTIDGFAGKSVRLRVDGSFDPTTCSLDPVPEFRFWNGPGDSTWYLDAPDAAGLRAQVWAVDVHGTRVAIQAATTSKRSGVIAEAAGIVNSIDFEPAGS